jgi:hypothetical protein
MSALVEVKQGSSETPICSDKFAIPRLAATGIRRD